MTDLSPIMKNGWAGALSILSSLVDPAATAREFKAFVRPRGVRSAEDLLRLVLAYGSGMSLRQGCAWAEVSDIADVSNPALLRRLSNAADWIEHIAMRLLEEAQGQPKGPWADWRLRIVDATSISRPGAKTTTWRLHVSYDLTGRVDGLELTGSKGAESLSRFAWRPGDVAVADRGYAKAKDLRKTVEAGAHVVARTGWNALALLGPDGQAFDLFSIFEAVGEEPVSVSVMVDTREEGRSPLPLRLIMRRLTEEQAEKARKKMREKASRQGKKLDPRSLKAAGYAMIVTSLPDEYSPRDVADLYRMRWQIELLFKRFKSLMDLGELPAKSEALAKTWIFSKLVIALLAEKAARHLAEFSPCRD